MEAIYFDNHGDVDVLRYGEQPVPVPADDEVLVRLHVAALNNLDLWVRRGWPGMKITYPFIPGADGAGEVADMGCNVNEWQVGDRVVINPNIGCWQCEFCQSGFDNRCQRWELLGEHRNGTYAQYVCVPAENLYKISTDINYSTVAAAALVYQTAWHSLITRGRLHAGERVLVVGASGGVNTASIQIAKLAGAVVYVIGSTKEKLELAQSCGADHIINRSENDNWSKVVYQMTDKQGVDVVVDNVGTTFDQSMRCLRKGGRLLTVGNTGGATFQIDNRFIFGKHISIIGSTMSPKSDFLRVMDLVIEGKLKPVLDKSYRLEESKIAQKHLEFGHQMGKITLLIP